MHWCPVACLWCGLLVGFRVQVISRGNVCGGGGGGGEDAVLWVRVEYLSHCSSLQNGIDSCGSADRLHIQSLADAGLRRVRKATDLAVVANHQ